MNYSVDERAGSEVHNIVGYYSRIRRRLAIEFIEDFHDQMRLVCANPRMGSSMGDGYRQILLRKFPYAAIYEIDKEADLIHVIAVTHQHRHPDYWRDRIQEEPGAYRLAA